MEFADADAAACMRRDGRVVVYASDVWIGRCRDAGHLR